MTARMRTIRTAFTTPSFIFRWLSINFIFRWGGYVLITKVLTWAGFKVFNRQRKVSLSENTRSYTNFELIKFHDFLWLMLIFEKILTYRIYSTISRDPKLWTCRLRITRTTNKSKTPDYKARPIHYYKTELLTTGKPNIFGKKITLIVINEA